MKTDIKTSDEVVGGVLNNLTHLQDLIESIQKLTNTYNTLKYKVENLEGELAEKRKELIEKESWANLGKFSTFIAHQIRSPINAIVLYIDHLREYIKNLPNTMSIQTILNDMELAANSINDFINDMLNFGRDIKLVREQILVSDFVVGLNKKISVLIRKKPTVEISFMFEEDFVINVDRRYFEQALFNLIKNANEAISAASENSLAVGSSGPDSISVVFYKDQYAYYVEVKDTGGGIPSYIVENLFTPFSSSKKEGFGLGLAFAKKIINAHNGTIELRSTGPSGTFFLIKIPILGGSNGN